MKEGTVPVPPYRPALSEDDVGTSSGVIALRESQRRG